jgi:glyoxylase-like metal-dependent hydrolase (beta-lactamase superfamily II)
LGFQDIQIIILTHEHLDHLGAAAHFSGSALIAAHRLAAHKISIGDEFVLSNKYFDQAEGKGDHRHYLETECPYRFISLRQLVTDFYNDMEKFKRGEEP